VTSPLIGQINQKVRSILDWVRHNECSHLFVTNQVVKTISAKQKNITCLHNSWVTNHFNI
jgi:hypothetical protein